MTLSRKAKEAIKTGLAMAIAYAIALQMGWDRPYWAAFAVALISLPTAGQSLRKGALRMLGTLVAGAAALIIVALFPQERWWFMVPLSVYFGFCTYMMAGTKDPYFYQVSAFVCVIICFNGAADPLNTFQTAMTRIQETGMGVLVYSLVAILLWPHNTAGELKEAARKLAAVQRGLFGSYRAMMSGTGSDEDFGSQKMQAMQLLTGLEQALEAAETDSYEVWEVRYPWRRFVGETKVVMETLERWRMSFPETDDIELSKLLPNLEVFCSELAIRFEQIQGMLAGEAPAQVLKPITLAIDKAELAALPDFHKAAIAVTKAQLDRLEALTRGLFDCVQDIKGFGGQPSVAPREEALRAGLSLDPDRIAAVMSALSTLWLGFFIWVYVDPPGHAGFVTLAASFGLITAKSPQLRPSKLFLPLLLSCLFAGVLYIFVMPHLSGYLQLGLMIFAATFGIAYLFSEPRQGLARNFGLAFFAVITGIDNQQSYSFTHVASTTLEAVLIVCLLVVTSYIPHSPRPEKSFLRLLHRYFRQAGFLMSQPTRERSHTNEAAGWRKTIRYRNYLLALPEKLGTWGAMVDHGAAPGSAPEQVQALVTSLQALAYRIEELVDARGNPQALFLVQELRSDMRAWRLAVQGALRHLSKDPATGQHEAFRARLDEILDHLEERVEDTLDKAPKGRLSDQDGENFYRLLGAYRGVSEALVDYAGRAGAIDWARWREERFA